MKKTLRSLGTLDFGIVTLVCFALLSCYALTRPLPDVVVIRTDRGFEPARVTIRKGQAIVFKNETDLEIWPASDFHPSHALYPEFDPKQPVEVHGSWRFVFTKPGVWTYHDHMDEYARATIVVEGAPGEARAACLAVDSSSSYERRAQCWAVDLTDTLQRHGLAAAFDEFAKIYRENPSFRGTSCHDAMHILGTAAYKAYEHDLTTVNRPETAYCGYGFYHGFMEAMTAEQGPSQYGNVRSYCDSLKSDGHTTNASGACYHGIGHAAFDSIPGTTWGDPAAMVKASLSVCETVATGTPERMQCSTGVFNAYAVAESAHTYGLSFPTRDPFAICRAQKVQYRAGCYVEHGVGYIRENELDRAGVIKLFKTIPDHDGADQMLGGYVGDEAIRAIANIDLPSLFDVCAQQADASTRHTCNRGVLSGLRQGGEPGHEYRTMFDYCRLFPQGDEKRFCETFTIQQSKMLSADRADFSSVCAASVEPDLVSDCR